jgi:hypothetical protein
MPPPAVRDEPIANWPRGPAHAPKIAGHARRMRSWLHCSRVARYACSRCAPAGQGTTQMPRSGHYRGGSAKRSPLTLPQIDDAPGPSHHFELEDGLHTGMADMGTVRDTCTRQSSGAESAISSLTLPSVCNTALQSLALATARDPPIWADRPSPPCGRERTHMWSIWPGDFAFERQPAGSP